MDSTSGLFFAPQLEIHGAEAQDAFCKPINIRIYSAPPPVRMRVVSYEMVYWVGSAQPDVNARWGEMTRYQSTFTGQRTFTFTIGTAPKLLDGLLTDIRRHFFSVVLHHKPCRTKEAGVDRMMGMNTSVHTFTDEAGATFRAYDVHHIVSIALNPNKAHFVSRQDLQYHCVYTNGETTHQLIDRYMTAPLDYEDNRRLGKRALSHLMAEETLGRLVKLSS